MFAAKKSLPSRSLPSRSITPGNMACALWAVVLAVALGLALPSPAAEVEAPSFDFEIEAQPLRKALIAFSRTTRRQVAADSRAIRGLDANAVRGRMSALAALERMVAGTGLGLVIVNGNSFALRPRRAAAAVTKLESIVVTATKISRDLQRVIGAGVTLSATQIERRNLITSEELFNNIPGLQMQDYGGFSAQPTVMIRGVGTDRPEYENSVQIVNDGLALGDSIMTNFPLFDVEQVEVLRGPQSTLYGKNAEGGIVNITSHRPENVLAANAEIWANTHRGVRLSSALSGPVVEDRILSRLSFIYDREEGDVKNPLNGEYIDGGETLAGRLVNVFNITDKLRADLQLMASSVEDNGMEAYTFPNRSSTPVLNRNPDPYITRTRTQAGILQVFWDMGSLQLTSISAFAHADSLGRGNSPFNLIPKLVNDREYTGWTQELRLTSDNKSQVQWLAGFFGSTGTRAEGFDLISPPQIFDLNTEHERHSIAVFGEATWNLSDAFRVTGGARLSWDSAEITGDDRASAFVFATRGRYNGKTRDTTISPKIGLAYDLTDNNTVYALVAHGYKPGGYNTVNLLTPDIPPLPAIGFPGLSGTGPRPASDFQYERESVLSYEIGSKNRFFEDRLELNAAVYYQDWRNKQVQELNRATYVTDTGNADRAYSYGFEADLRFEATHDLILSGGLLLGRSQYEDYVYRQGPQLKGNQIDFFSKFQGNLSATWYVPIFDRRLSITSVFRYRSRQYFDPLNTLSQPGFSLLDASLNYDFNERIALRIWGKNLSDERYITYKFDDEFGRPNSVTGTRADGLQAGVSLSLSL